MKPIRIALVEDDSEIRQTTSLILKTETGFELTGIYENGKQFLEALEKNRPDVVLMDIQMPQMNGIETVRKAAEKFPEIQFLMCTVFEDHDSIFESLKAGATGYILKNTPVNKLFDAKREIYEGGSPMSAQIARMVIRSFNAKDKSGAIDLSILSEREKDVLELLADGLLYKEIGERLFISIGTVRQHIHNIYKKLQVQNRTEAINKAYGR
ncbi:MAG: response regulator transcription factor [Bacteroidia bacterium]